MNFLATGTASSLTLVYLTDDKFGRDEPLGTGGAPVFVRGISNRLVWLAIFDGVSPPRFGKIIPSGATYSEPPSTGVARIWVAIDARTGQVLGGRTITPAGQ